MILVGHYLSIKKEVILFSIYIAMGLSIQASIFRGYKVRLAHHLLVMDPSLGFLRGSSVVQLAMRLGVRALSFCCRTDPKCSLDGPSSDTTNTALRVIHNNCSKVKYRNPVRFYLIPRLICKFSCTWP